MIQLIFALLIAGLYISALGRSLVDAKYHSITEGSGGMPPSVDIYVKYPFHFLVAWVGGFCAQYLEGVWWAISVDAQDQEVEDCIETDKILREAIKKSEEES